VLAELAERTLDDVALLVRRTVERGWPAAPAATTEPVADLAEGSGIFALIPRLRR